MSDLDDNDSDLDDIVTGGLIVPIQQCDVQRIVAGQVISDLSSAVKELIDNALDAGAKSIHSKSKSLLSFTRSMIAIMLLKFLICL